MNIVHINQWKYTENKIKELSKLYNNHNSSMLKTKYGYMPQGFIRINKGDEHNVK